MNPDFLSLLKEYPTDIFDGIEEALSDTPSVAARVNPLKGVAPPAGRKPVAWNECGFYLPRRIPFTFDPSLHQGLYYVQDASSMIISRIIKQISGEKPVTYLDACAAPGGKTTAAISVLPQGSVVVANEYETRRVAALRENLMKWGYPATVVTAGDTRQFRGLPHFFDIIAADVPCSGEGMMRKDDDAVEQWSKSLVKSCAFRQREIIDNIIGSLRHGGYLIYSTCTFNREENEKIIDYICDTYGFETIAISVDTDWGIDSGIATRHHCLRFIPGRVDGEGLFVALLRKPDGDDNRSDRTDERKKTSRQKTADFSRLLSDDFVFDTGSDGRVTAFPSVSEITMRQLLRRVKVVDYGIEIGQMKGKNLIPSQSLAMSVALNPNAFPTVEISLTSAIDYLRHLAITLPEGAPHGIVLLTFEARPLGFVKNLGNRANNLYPQSMRILSQNNPVLIERALSPTQ